MRDFKYQKTKTIKCKENGRSSDIVSANFILGCDSGCSKSYCYVKRFDRPYIYVNTNTEDILNSCDEWVNKQIWSKVPNQCDSKYYIVDIGCATDISKYWKNYDWIKVFNWFKSHSKLKATFATKFVNNKLLEYNPEQKVRIRFSLMPQVMSYILEPNTTKIKTRIEAVQRFMEAGYEVHLNISPIVVYSGWEEDYDDLLGQLDTTCKSVKDKLRFEVIFLTHEKGLHERNLVNLPEVEEVLWRTEIQENKVSNYGGHNVRYEYNLKREYIKIFKDVFSKYFDIGQIRYIF